MEFEVSNEQLTARSDALRFTEPKSISELDVEVAASVAQELQAIGTDYRYQALTVPPPDIRERLRIVGRYMYEVAWRVVDGDKLPRDWGLTLADKPDELREAEDQVGLLERLDQTARILPWREYAPRALGAIRSKGLAAAKKNDRQGFLDAWSFHFEADEMYKDFSETLSHSSDPEIRSFAHELDSVQQQLLLAQTGTSCRQAERAFALNEQSPRGEAERSTFEYVFAALEDGAFSGREAIHLIEEVERDYGLVSRANNTHLLGPQNFRNAGCMAARAHLLLLPMTSAMDGWSRPKPVGYASWDAYRDELQTQIVAACHAIEREKAQPFDRAHLRQIAFIRLSLAFLTPAVTATTCLHLIGTDDSMDWDVSGPESALTVDDGEIIRISTWLAADRSNGGDAGDDLVLGSVNMPAYFDALRTHMTRVGTWARYVRWRTEWPQLDRHHSATRSAAFAAMMAAADN